MTLVSVIVPVYQSRDHISRCIDSVLSQTLRDIELLLVDDGSTDGTIEICDEYVKKDSRVQVIRKCHSGVSDSRQLGYDSAKGEYVIFCDADDWMDHNMLELMSSRAETNRADVVICDYYEELRNSIIYRSQFPCGYNNNVPLLRQISNVTICLWNKLFRKSLFESYSITFPKGIQMGEDLYIFVNVFNQTVKVGIVQLALYHYDHSNPHKSILESLDKKSIYSNIEVFRLLPPSMDRSIEEKINESKIFLLQNSYRKRLMTKDELRSLFPEIHPKIASMSLKHPSLFCLMLILYNGNIIRIIKDIILEIKS